MGAVCAFDGGFGTIDSMSGVDASRGHHTHITTAMATRQQSPTYGPAKVRFPRVEKTEIKTLAIDRNKYN